MRKFYLFACLILFSSVGFSQSFSGPTNAASGATVTLTAVGESTPAFGTNNYAFNSVNQIYSTETTITYQGGTYNYGYVDGSNITAVINTYNATHTATTIKLFVKNTFVYPVTATFYIHASYNTYSNSYSDVKIPYTITIQPAPAPPINNTLYEGDFVRDDNTLKIYYVFESRLRWVPTYATLNGLWSYNDSMLKHFTTAQLAGNPMGADFTSDNALIVDTNTSKVYLREGSYIRWIPSSAMFNAYHFNWNNIHSINGIGFYTVGPNVTF